MTADSAPKGPLWGCIVVERKRCGKPNCRCVRGELHGPYYYRRWRDAFGRQRKAYVPRERLREVRSALEKARLDSPRVRLREMKKLLDGLDDEARTARQRMSEELGRYWHGRQLRERRSVPAEQRDRALYHLNPESIQAACGWPITEDDFAALQGMIRSERKRRNRLRRPWAKRNPVTGQEVLALEIDLMRLPSYRRHVERQREADRRRLQ